MERGKNELSPGYLFQIIITIFNGCLVSPALAQIFCAPLFESTSIGRDVAIHFRFAFGEVDIALHRSSFVPLLQLWAASSPSPCPSPPSLHGCAPGECNPTRPLPRPYSFFRGYFHPRFALFLPSPSDHFAARSKRTKESGVCSWRVFARERALIANDCFRRVPPFREKVTGEVRATRVPNPDG